MTVFSKKPERSAVRLAALALFVAVPFATVHAQTITFAGLAGVNHSPFTSYSEAGFSIVANRMCRGMAVGSPVPSAVGGAACNSGEPYSSMIITRLGGATFQFLSIDLASSFGNSTYLTEGFLGAVSLYGQGGVFTAPVGSLGQFGTVNNANAAVFIDRLELSFDTNSAQSSHYIDNIRMSATTVPEPTTLALIGVGLSVLAGARYRRRPACMRT
jgi:hypothetical protein